MRTSNTKLIILGHRNIREADKMLFVYSEEHGKLRLIAKGARRHKSKFLGHTQSLIVADASLYFGPRNTLLTEIKPISSPKKINDSLIKTICALQIAEITERCVLENQKIPGLFDLLETTLKNLNKSHKSRLIVTTYTIKFLHLLGLLPDFKEIRTKLPEKYKRFFEYVKIENFDKLLKIALNEKDENIIQDITKRLIENQNGTEIKALSPSMSFATSTPKSLISFHQDF
ncbi:MAG: DNA repair protein RecO [Candidatus Gracilibacteria bacterium]|jgi:recombinational DNA repair protein (RecF pathway)|nr:DNA repair protein RecO [Candidatus Gracilibacteria bacterium]